MQSRCFWIISLVFWRALFVSSLVRSSKIFGWNMQAAGKIVYRSSPKLCLLSGKERCFKDLSRGATRLFGSKRGVPGNPLGTIAIYNDQDDITDIDENALRETVKKISKIIGYETYDVALLLVDDEEMQETNLESRGVDAPTDILSFPFHAHKKPGLLVEPEFDIPDYYTLGDMMVDVAYVIRRCKEDKEDREEFSDSDDEERGVSGAMATVYDPEKRIHMLLVHGMLHLVGYDHEDDDEYEEMVEREEEILKELGNTK